MPSITVKNIPDKLYKKIKASAGKNRRSINSEIITLLENNFSTEKIDIEKLIKEAEEIKSNLSFVVNEEELQYAKNEGRS